MAAKQKNFFVVKQGVVSQFDDDYTVINLHYKYAGGRIDKTVYKKIKDTAIFEHTQKDGVQGLKIRDINL